MSKVISSKEVSRFENPSLSRASSSFRTRVLDFTTSIKRNVYK